MITIILSTGINTMPPFQWTPPSPPALGQGAFVAAARLERLRIGHATILVETATGAVAGRLCPEGVA